MIVHHAGREPIRLYEPRAKTLELMSLKLQHVAVDKNTRTNFPSVLPGRCLIFPKDLPFELIEIRAGKHHERNADIKRAFSNQKGTERIFKLRERRLLLLLHHYASIFPAGAGRIRLVATSGLGTLEAGWSQPIRSELAGP